MGKEMNSKETAILEAAIKVINKKGFNAATTKEIAREAGVAEGTIFNYFPTKKDILHQLILKAVGQISPQIAMDSLDSTLGKIKTMDGETALRNFFKDRVKLCVENMNLLKIGLIESQYDPDLRDILGKDMFSPSQTMIEQYFNDAIASGIFRQFDVSILTACTLGLTLSLILAENRIKNRRNYLNHAHGGYDEVIDGLVDILFYGIAKDSQNKVHQP